MSTKEEKYAAAEAEFVRAVIEFCKSGKMPEDMSNNCLQIMHGLYTEGFVHGAAWEDNKNRAEARMGKRNVKTQISDRDLGNWRAGPKDEGESK